MMPAQFSRFTIEGLRGSDTVSATIKDNTLILVGENGSGKTTFLRIMFYFLSGRWGRLAQFEFSRVTAEIDGKEYSIEHKDISSAGMRFDDRVMRSLPAAQRRRVSDLLDASRFEEAEVLIGHYASRYGYSRSSQPDLFFARDERTAQQLAGLYEAISRTINAQILYLPTYRRIERELSSIVKGIDPDSPQIVRQPEDANDYVELVEFGMNDVKAAIHSTLEDIRNFQLHGTTRLSLSYLGDVVSQSYLQTEKDVIANASSETIEAVLNRIDETILSGYHKAHLRDIIVSAKTNITVPSEHEQIIYHYFTKLVKFQGELQAKERNIKLFCDLCTEYIKDKVFLYESGKFSFRIQQKNKVVSEKDRPIELSDLSSGEKQIVSLFSHLYLSGRENFFVLIDEPELSLSVPWQRRFLIDIRDASLCAGLVAVTHSPFIYDNKLRPYTRALGEFVTGADWGNIQ